MKVNKRLKKKPKFSTARKTRRVTKKPHVGLKVLIENNTQQQTDGVSIEYIPSTSRAGSSRRKYSSSSNSPNVRKNVRNLRTTGKQKYQGKRRTISTDAGPFEPEFEDSASSEEQNDQVSVEVKTEKYAAEYDMDHTGRGICVVFNHEKFNRQKERKGTHKDVENIKYVFSNVLGFDVFVHQDKTKKEILEQIEFLRQQDHTNYDCLAIFVLSHGDSCGYVSAKDEHYNLEELWKPFTADKCSSLSGKPKLFFINACRGIMKDYGVNVHKRGRIETDGGPSGSYKIPTNADILIAQSTVEGFFSYRNIDNGTWYIQALCETLREHCNTHDLLKILTITSRKVAICMATQTTQTPSFISMLTRDLYLRPKPKSEELHNKIKMSFCFGMNKKP